MDFYAAYAAWHTRFYGVPYPVTREQWQSWCKAPPHRPLTDLEFDAEQERMGNAQ